MVDEITKHAAAQSPADALERERVLAELLDTDAPTPETRDLIARLRQAIDHRRPPNGWRAPADLRGEDR